MNIKVGDMVKINEHDYPQYKGKIGVVLSSSSALPQRWCVIVDGKIHPFFIHSDSLTVIY